jgi:hypothetical protein
MRTNGAFLVSAQMKDGKVIHAEIQSLAGEKCIIDMTNLSHLKCSSEIVMTDSHTAEIRIAKGQKAVFTL